MSQGGWQHIKQASGPDPLSAVSKLISLHVFQPLRPLKVINLSAINLGSLQCGRTDLKSVGPRRCTSRGMCYRLLVVQPSPCNERNCAILPTDFLFSLPYGESATCLTSNSKSSAWFFRSRTWQLTPPWAHSAVSLQAQRSQFASAKGNGSGQCTTRVVLCNASYTEHAVPNVSLPLSIEQCLVMTQWGALLLSIHGRRRNSQVRGCVVCVVLNRQTLRQNDHKEGLAAQWSAQDSVYLTRFSVKRNKWAHSFPSSHGDWGNKQKKFFRGTRCRNWARLLRQTAQ